MTPAALLDRDSRNAAQEPPELEERQAGESLRICSVLTSLTAGGAENLVVNLNREFVRSGAHSSVVALCDASAVGNSSEIEAHMHKRIVDHGGEFVSMGLGSGRGLIAGARALVRLDRQLRPSIWHLHTARAACYALLAGIRTPIVLTHHNSKLSFPPALFRLFDRLVDGYVAISADTSEIYQRYSKRPCRTIINAAGGEYNVQGPRSGGWTKPTVLSVGAASKQKNYDLLIETAAALRDLLPAEEMPRFLIAGGGNSLDGLRDQARRRGLQDAVQFLGVRSDIPALMENSDVFLNTSIYEGLPVAVIEAMSMALPIIATNVPGNRDLVTDGENGLLVQPGDPHSVASALKRVVSSQTLYRRMSARSLEMSRSYSIASAAQAHLALYKSLVESPVATR